MEIDLCCMDERKGIIQLNLEPCSGLKLKKNYLEFISIYSFKKKCFFSTL